MIAGAPGFPRLNLSVSFLATWAVNHDSSGAEILASATANGSAASSDVQRAIADIRSVVIKRPRGHTECDVLVGMLPRPTDATALAGLVMAIMQGLSVLARDGMGGASL